MSRRVGSAGVSARNNVPVTRVRIWPFHAKPLAAFHLKRALENYFDEFADLRIALNRLHNLF